MPTPEEHRVCKEIMRLMDGAKLRLLEGVNGFKMFDDAGKLAVANDSIKNGADTVIRMKNRIANALKNTNIALGATMGTFYGYSVQDLRNEMSPILTIANQIISNYPNIARAQVDSISIRKPELVDNPTAADI